MGTSQSSLSDNQNVFRSNGNGQIGFHLIESLQQNPESDTTRRTASELEIQKKVANELQKIQSKEDSIAKDLEERLSRESGEGYHLDRNTVGKSITTLSEKLSAQSKISELNETVKTAEAALVRCLRLNDRRPLDCWKEVEEFKRQVADLENGFVDRIVGNS